MSKTKEKRFEITYVYLVRPYNETKKIIFANSEKEATQKLINEIEEKVNLDESSEPFNKKNVSISKISYMDIEQ